MEDNPKPPQKCCGEWPNQEAWDFFVCRQCGGEIKYDVIMDSEEGDCEWIYDCPRGKPPRDPFGY